MHHQVVHIVLDDRDRLDGLHFELLDDAVLFLGVNYVQVEPEHQQHKFLSRLFLIPELDVVNGVRIDVLRNGAAGFIARAQKVQLCALRLRGIRL